MLVCIYYNNIILYQLSFVIYSFFGCIFSLTGSLFCENNPVCVVWINIDFQKYLQKIKWRKIM